MNGLGAARDIIVGCLFAAAGCVALMASVQAARRSRNWLFYICALGSLVFVLGVAVQRTFPSEDAQRRDPVSAGHSAPGAWEAGVQIPVVHLFATPVAVGGFLVSVLGLSLVLFFEAVPQEHRDLTRPLLDAEDAV